MNCTWSSEQLWATVWWPSDKVWHTSAFNCARESWTFTRTWSANSRELSLAINSTTPNGKRCTWPWIRLIWLWASTTDCKPPNPLIRLERMIPCSLIHIWAGLFEINKFWPTMYPRLRDVSKISWSTTWRSRKRISRMALDAMSNRSTPLLDALESSNAIPIPVRMMDIARICGANTSALVIDHSWDPLVNTVCRLMVTNWWTWHWWTRLYYSRLYWRHVRLREHHGQFGGGEHW